MIDAVNKSGVPLFYPSPIRAVMPKPEKWRIQVGSKSETIVFIIILIAVFALIPLNQIGLFRALHRVIKDTQSSIADYRTWADSYRVHAIVTGTFNVSQQPITSQFEVLGVENRNALVVYDARADQIYTVGTDEDASIYPRKIHCIRGEPINIITKKVNFKYELLGSLVNHIPPDGQTFIKGTVKTEGGGILPGVPDMYETIRPGFNEVELRYARKPDFENVAVSTIFVLSGDVYLRTILPATSPSLSHSGVMEQKSYFARNAKQFAVLPASMNVISGPSYFSRPHIADMQIHNVQSLNEILVVEGQFIKAGDLIALLTHSETKLKLEAQTIRRDIAQLQAQPIDSHSLFLASQKVKAKQREFSLEQEIFKSTQKLYESKAISRIAFIKEQQKLKQAEVAIIEAEQEFEQVKQKLEWEAKQRQYQVDQAMVKLKAIQQEREQSNIYSAVNARVLLIKTHSINNNNLTIAIKLLVNPPEPSSSIEPIPKPQITPPPIQKEEPQSDSFMKVMERKSSPKPVSFFKKSAVYKKTHTQNHDKKTSKQISNHPRIPNNPNLFSISFLRNEPVAPKHYHKSSFFT
jgi:hypothetical protein